MDREEEIRIESYKYWRERERKKRKIERVRERG